MGWNKVVGANTIKIIDAFQTFSSSPIVNKSFIQRPYGSGDAAEKIAKHIINYN